MRDRSDLSTEKRLAASMRLDAMSVAEALVVMSAQDAAAVAAVAGEAAAVERAIDLVVAALGAGGRLIYAGAGTSGRLGVLDAAECPPTFRSEPGQVQGIIAGGNGAMFAAVEGAEDSAAGGEAAMDERQVGASDVVMGIAAGGTTPFVHGALARARERGAKTIFLCCVAPFAGEPDADVVIRPVTGPEVLTGSTRLKAGTATKLVLNQITTLAMVQLGKVYENLMVDLRASNEKLRDRAARIVGELTGASREEAVSLVEAADGQVKTAVVMGRLGVSGRKARELLGEHEGKLRQTLDQGRKGRTGA